MRQEVRDEEQTGVQLKSYYLFISEIFSFNIYRWLGKVKNGVDVFYIILLISKGSKGKPQKCCDEFSSHTRAQAGSSLVAHLHYSSLVVSRAEDQHRTGGAASSPTSTFPPPCQSTTSGLGQSTAKGKHSLCPVCFSSKHLLQENMAAPKGSPYLPLTPPTPQGFLALTSAWLRFCMEMQKDQLWL